MGEYCGVGRSTDVQQTSGRVGGWQIHAAFALVLVEPGTKNADFLSDRRVNPSRRVVGLLVLAERDGPASHGNAGEPTISRVDDLALVVIPLRIEPDETPDPVHQDWSTKGESREHVTVMPAYGLVALRRGINISVCRVSRSAESCWARQG